MVNDIVPRAMEGSGMMLQSIDTKHRVRTTWSEGLLTGAIIVRPSNGNLVLFLLNIREEALDPLVLHRVLDRSEEDILLVAFTYLECLGEVDHCVAELRVDGFLDEDTFDSHADLTGVQKGECSNLGSHFFDVHVVTDDCWVISSELEGDTLQRLSRACHDLLSRKGRPGEADFV